MFFTSEFVYNYIYVSVVCRWYVENINRVEAERTLIEKDEKGGFYNEAGAFLVRNSESSAGEYSLSVK